MPLAAIITHQNPRRGKLVGWPPEAMRRYRQLVEDDEAAAIIAASLFRELM